MNALPEAAPQDFVDIQQVIPGILLDLRYVTGSNFVGQPIDGYRKPKCLLTRAAAEALKSVQIELNEHGYGLKLYDCYRPQSAVDHFMRWAERLEDTRTKSLFYPRVDKKNLLEQGYIAEKSGHSRGSTVDLTLVRFSVRNKAGSAGGKIGSAKNVEMGTRFDFFDPLSHTDNPQIQGNERKNRQLLKSVMARRGFVNLPEEWWHYTLRNEPYPDTYFDFPVE